MRRKQLLTRAETLKARGFTDETRREFDRLMGEIEALPREPDAAVPLDGGFRGGVHPTVAETVSAPAPATPRALRPSPDSTSLTGRRRILSEQIAALDAAGAYPRAIVVGGTPYSARGLLRVLGTLPHALVDQAQRAVNEAEDLAFERAERDAADAERAARLAAVVQTEDERAEAAELLDAARRDAERDDSIAGRLERVEALLAKLAEAR